MAGVTAALTERFQGVLDVITRVRGVRGAMLIAREDGLVVAEALMEGVRGKAVAALAASLFQRLRDASGTAGAGEPQFVHLQGDDGVLLILPAGQQVLIAAVAAANANVGLMRLEMLRAVSAVR